MWGTRSKITKSHDTWRRGENSGGVKREYGGGDILDGVHEKGKTRENEGGHRKCRVARLRSFWTELWISEYVSLETGTVVYVAQAREVHVPSSDVETIFIEQGHQLHHWWS